MKLPRDVAGPELVKALRKLGYQVNQQRGSHIRVTTQQGGEHHEVVPNHHPIKPGSPVGGVLKPVAAPPQAQRGSAGPAARPVRALQPAAFIEWRELTDASELATLP